MESALFLAIKPQYSSKILSGNKKVELRKSIPSGVERDSIVIIYSTSPEKRVVAIGIIARVVKNSPNQIWAEYRNDIGITKREFDNYYENSSTAVALVFTQIVHLNKYLDLDDIRKRIPKFSPPQTYRYVRLSTLQVLFNSEFVEVRNKIRKIKRM